MLWKVLLGKHLFVLDAEGQRLVFDSLVATQRHPLPESMTNLLQCPGCHAGWVHPNLNLEDPEDGVDTNILVGPKKQQLDIDVALSNSFGFGGHNSSILFRAFK